MTVGTPFVSPYTPEQRAEALELALASRLPSMVGRCQEASAATGIPAPTIETWLRREDKRRLRTPPMSVEEARNTPAAALRAKLRTDLMVAASLLMDDFLRFYPDLDEKSRKDALAGVQTALSMYRLEAGEATSLSQQVPSLDAAKARLAELLGVGPDDLEAEITRRMRSKAVTIQAERDGDGELRAALTSPVPPPQGESSQPREPSTPPDPTSPSSPTPDGASQA